jgi:hypothetical protein|tara:strand:+ start:135 stop:731 length:597 start_codon:yes stop_codon:yes gene_type:complete
MADLVTTHEYKDAEGIRGEKDDDRLNLLVPQISDLVKKYCGTSFVDYISTDKVETFTINDNFTSTITVSESPLTVVDIVKERTAYSEAYVTLTTADHEYYVDTDADAIIRTTISGRPRNWAQGVGAVQITYNAGFAACPKDLKLAVFDLITYYLKNEHKQRQSLGGATVQNQGTSGARQSTDFPDHIKRVLDLYRVVV